MAREAGRLRMSLQAAGEAPRKIAFLHYPPVYPGASAEELVAVLQEFGVTECYYGHLHGKSIRFAVQGDVEGIRYRLISADGLQFLPLQTGWDRLKKAQKKNSRQVFGAHQPENGQKSKMNCDFFANRAGILRGEHAIITCIFMYIYFWRNL